MNAEQAEHTLETIRTLMERSQRYEHISGHSGLIAGSLVLIGCAILKFDLLPFAAPVNFIAVWSVVLALALMAHIAVTHSRARQRGERVWSRQARTVLLALLPTFVASVFVSALMWKVDRLDILPAFWLLLYGCGTLATSFFAPRSILLLGIICLLLAGVSMTVWTGWPLLTMAIGFGLTHLTYGALVLFAEWRENCKLARWAAEQLSWQQNSMR